MNLQFLEQFYENVILPQYSGVVFDSITWLDHGSVGPDAFAHYFKTAANQEYVLVFEDFPGEVAFDDGLSHDIVPASGNNSLKFGGEVPFKYIENITGYFTLYIERKR